MSQELFDAITILMQSLYGPSGRDLLRDDLLALQSKHLSVWIEPAIEKLRKADLVVAGFLETSIKRTGIGLKAFLSETYLALALGKDFILRITRPSIVHIIVSGKKKKETGGTGFYCADVGNRLVTAAHNVLDREILKVENANGTILHSPPIAVHAFDEKLDLAILDTMAPQGTSCLKVEWDKDEILPLTPLYVVGFPQVPQQALAPITYKSTELAATGQDYGRRETYLIKSATSPGFSGGPAINHRGRVVGVVQGTPENPTDTAATEQDKDTMSKFDKEEVQSYDSDYSVLIPAFLLEEVEPSLQERRLVIMANDLFQ